jgi:hypothetical protein
LNLSLTLESKMLPMPTNADFQQLPGALKIGTLVAIVPLMCVLTLTAMPLAGAIGIALATIAGTVIGLYVIGKYKWKSVPSSETTALITSV